MKGIFIGTGREPFIIDFEDELNNLQALVGGNIEVLSIKEKGNRSIDLIFNEECKFLFQEVNKFYIFPNGLYDYLSGNIICVAANLETGEFESLTQEEIEYYMTFFLDDKLFL